MMTTMRNRSAAAATAAAATSDLPAESSSAPATPTSKKRRPSASDHSSLGIGPLTPEIKPLHTNRPRIGSHPSDIPRTYSGLYGTGGSSGDLLPFELSRNRNTDWIDTQPGILLLLYLLVIIGFEGAVLVSLPAYAALPLPPGLRITFANSWTLTNVTHGFVTILYLHWIKGSPDHFEQNEMLGMTTWEQIVSDPNHAESRKNQKLALKVVPTVLCHLACHFCDYDNGLSAINVGVWVVCIVAKLDRMNGVRLFGINKTVGVDDDALADGASRSSEEEEEESPLKMD